MLPDVGDIPIQELRNCGIKDKQLMEVISDSVKKVLTQEPLRPLVLGGDQSASYPVVKAIHEHYGLPVDVLHFDARPDLSKTSANNPYSDASTFARIIEGKHARKLIQVGLRSMTKEERDRANKSAGAIQHYEMQTLASNLSVLKQLTETLGGPGVIGVYISIDMSCLDPSIAPGVSYYEPGGLALLDVIKIIQNLNKNIIGADVVEYNPNRDTHNHITASVAARIVQELAAKLAIPR